MMMKKKNDDDDDDDRILTRSVEGIEAAFCRVRRSAEKALGGDEDAKDQSFQDIFALNNEIGRLGRRRSELMPRMKELQGYVNAITIAIKYGRMDDLREGLSTSEQGIKNLKKELASTP